MQTSSRMRRRPLLVEEVSSLICTSRFCTFKDARGLLMSVSGKICEVPLNRCAAKLFSERKIA